MAKILKKVSKINKPDFILYRPLIFFDLETTGLNPFKDRIVSITMCKLMPDFTEVTRSHLINPTIKIPKEATAVNKITNEMVTQAPIFKHYSKAIYKFFEGCDIAGFNNNEYDNIILSEELARCNLLFPAPDTKSIDVCFLFKKLERRNLSAAMQYYCGVHDFDKRAHSSEEDTKATMQVFLKMTEKYNEFKEKDLTAAFKMCNRHEKQLDFQGQLYKNEQGDICYNIGKSKGKTIKQDPLYAHWILTHDFPTYTKLLIKKELERLDAKK